MTQEEFKKRYTFNKNDILGEGGFGKVFRAYDNYLDRWVAIKIADVRHDTLRLRKEVEMVKTLPAHPNIARYEDDCYTFEDLDGECDYAVLQYYEEGNMMQIMRGNAMELKIAILTQILDGLDFLHVHGIIHRDLKPQNILMVKRQNGEYVPKITDFGISKKLDINVSSVVLNSIAGVGTLAYASPEQLADREIRKNTDLWSFGVIAYQAFTGQLPFTSGEYAPTSEAGRQELFRQINSGQLPDGIASIEEPWQMLIRRCLVTDASKRIKNAQEAKEILAGKNAFAYGNET